MANESRTIQEVAALIDGVPGVQSVNVWEQHGKARVYINLPKLNGGRHWNGGRAGTVWYDASDGRIHAKGDWAGAATRDRAYDIIEKIEAVLAGAPVSASYTLTQTEDAAYWRTGADRDVLDRAYRERFAATPVPLEVLDQRGTRLFTVAPKEASHETH